ncbi:hypothetical protein EVAR_3002_1 [Eumeta japonica]|uniref:Uncharacterized protein n=1 Tax=Eumeta variegata TaxID=151549 RepID=A0A4C1SWD6_EUMVA|nr:hypothetical protein EVAR_3002_1 [Eumeta japonica]
MNAFSQRITKGSILVPNAENYARHAVESSGNDHDTTGGAAASWLQHQFKVQYQLKTVLYEEGDPVVDHLQEVSNPFQRTVMKLVTKASQWRKIGKRGRRRKSGEALNVRITSIAGISERQSLVRYTIQSRAQKRPR